MPPIVRIVTVTENERDDAVRIIAEYLCAIDEPAREEVTQREVDAHIADRDSAVIVAMREDAPVGCIAVHSIAIPDAFEVKRMYVRPAARGGGVARSLLQAAQSFALERGALWVYLDTKPAMLEAIALYESEGFVNVPRYNDDPAVQVFMRKAL